MARHESEREDLIREAVALLPRAEFSLPELPEPLTIGLRNQAASFFFGQDQVYHFDPDGRLRRAFVAGFLFRSQHNGLARLERIRTETETQLLQSQLTSEELLQFRRQMHTRLQQVLVALSENNLKLLRSVPPDTDWTILITSRLHSICTADPWLSDTIRVRR